MYSCSWGYSLNDLNMRYIISEASRIGNVQSYAVVLDSPGPEARYWEQIGVRLIMQEASEFIDEVLKVFPANEFEWDQKSDTRVADKEEIANKAVKEIQKALEDEKGASQPHPRFWLDSGVSCTGTLPREYSEEH